VPTLWIDERDDGPSTHFVGRNAELTRVRSLFNDAALDTGAALILRGETGIGKSRFLRECARLKSLATIVTARCRGDGSDALTALIRRRRRRNAAALLVDDLQLAGPAELGTLRDAIARTRQLRLVVVGCYAPERTSAAFERELPFWHEAGASFGELPPLADTEIELLIRSIVSRSDASLEADSLRALLCSAQGNPRAAIELARAGGATADLPALAPSARATVAALRETMPASQFAVLALCSVLGARFCDRWIVDIAASSAETIAEVLQAGVDRGILEEVAERPGWLRFRLVTVREALYASLVSLKRRQSHERAAIYLSARNDADDAQYRSLVAEQWHAAGNADRATIWLTKAADAFAEGGEFRRAADAYARVVAHAQPGAAEWFIASHHLRRCYRNLAEWRRMIPVVESMLASNEPGRDSVGEEALLSDLFFAHLNDGELDAARRVAGRIAAVSSQHPHRATVAMLIVAYALCYTGRIDDAREILAGIDGDTLTDPEARLRRFLARASIETLYQPLDASLDDIERAADIARGLGIRGTVLCWANGVEVALRYGDMDAARAYVDKARADAARSAGDVNDAKWLTHRSRMRVAIFAGELTAARELLYESLAWRESGKHNQAFLAGSSTLVGLRIGDLALVDAMFDPDLLAQAIAADDAESAGVLLSGFIGVMQARGMTKEIQSGLQRCVDARLVDPYAWIPQCVARFGSLDIAEAATDLLQQHLKGAVAPTAAAHTALVRSMIARRHGKHIAACEFARDSAERYRRVGWRLAEASALELAGNDAAASQLYGACGATVDVARFGGLRSRKVRRAPFGARLTDRELEVSQLALHRRSNDEISRALGVSIRTVHHHVEASLSKLGIHSRHQLTDEMLESQRRRSSYALPSTSRSRCR